MSFKKKEKVRLTSAGCADFNALTTGTPVNITSLLTIKNVWEPMVCLTSETDATGWWVPAKYLLKE